jgi:autoinducer 2-degrading protein
MFVLLVYAHVKPESVEPFRKATLENARNSRLEPGVARFDVIQETEDPTRFTLIEIYRNRNGHAQHRETPHYNAWAAVVADMFVEPRTRTTYQSIDPPDTEW